MAPQTSGAMATYQPVPWSYEKWKENHTTTNMPRHGHKAQDNSGGPVEFHSSGGRICGQNNHCAHGKVICQ
ncbi:hypothetical protein CHARACLAT_006211 [Characodon lateralis]|uniref:Uncharacterized protein n=1 Tax=Characodon lateralis TaxID=208331 RepID=A0ABU7CVA3_9TELE|nr:hypothetical protein [Characodon lateralis]